MFLSPFAMVPLALLLAGLLSAVVPLAPRAQGPETAPVPQQAPQGTALGSGRRVEVRVRDVQAPYTGVLDRDLPMAMGGWVVIVQDGHHIALPAVNVLSVKEL